MPLDEELLRECADWIAEQLNEMWGGMLAAELIDLVLEEEAKLREEHNDAEMDHHTMSERLLPELQKAGVRVDRGVVTQQLAEEILQWEDDFLGLAGQARVIRPSVAQP